MWCAELRIEARPRFLQVQQLAFARQHDEALVVALLLRERGDDRVERVGRPFRGEHGAQRFPKAELPPKKVF